MQIKFPVEFEISNIFLLELVTNSFTRFPQQALRIEGAINNNQARCEECPAPASSKFVCELQRCHCSQTKSINSYVYTTQIHALCMPKLDPIGNYVWSSVLVLFGLFWHQQTKSVDDIWLLNPQISQKSHPSRHLPKVSRSFALESLSAH